jgi:hypothetical protein
MIVREVIFLYTAIDVTMRNTVVVWKKKQRDLKKIYRTIVAQEYQSIIAYTSVENFVSSLISSRKFHNLIE